MVLANSMLLATAAAFGASLALVSAQPQANPTACLDSVEAGVDYFPVKVEPTISVNWNVEYFDTYKVGTNIAAENQTYLLYQCGTEIPENEMDAGHTAIIPIPLDQLALTSTTDIPFVELLGQRQSISAWFGSTFFISSPCLVEMIDDGTVTLVRDASNSTLLEEAGVPPSVPVISNGFGTFVQEDILRVSATSEPQNLGSFEWIKFYSLFYNAEAEANRLFDEAEDRFQCVTNNAAIISKDLVDPTVLWAGYFESCGGWTIARCPNYYCEFAQECGANVLNGFQGSVDGPCGSVLTTAELVEFGKDADHFLYTSTDFNSIIANDTFAELKDLKSVQNEEVYDFLGAGPNSWFEQRLAEPDVVLQDFCAVIGTLDPLAAVVHERVYFRNVYTEAVGSQGQCEDRSAPLVSGTTVCVPKVEGEDMGNETTGGDNTDNGGASGDAGDNMGSSSSSSSDESSGVGICLSGAVASSLLLGTAFALMA